MHTIRSTFIISGVLICLISGCNEESNNQLYYEEAGSGETVIFVHGSQADYRFHLPQVDALKENYRVVTYSRRYNYPNGYEYNPNTNFSVSSEADDLNTDFDMPVMLITGGNTMPMLNCTNAALVERIPDAVHLHLPEATHNMWMSHTDELNRSLNDFISGTHDSYE